MSRIKPVLYEALKSKIIFLNHSAYLDQFATTLKPLAGEVKNTDTKKCSTGKS